MQTQVIPARMTAARTGEIVVFLIGMRVNRWWKIHRWLPVALAMSRMLRELRQRPNSGLLHATLLPAVSVQYWSSAEALLAYAADRTGQHYPAWADFYRRVGTNGDVGIWHETYVVPEGAYESMYVNMPPAGLGRFSNLVPAHGARSRARDRLGLPERNGAQEPTPIAAPGAGE
jgi:Domain of unknown function (DUF4188)